MAPLAPAKTRFVGRRAELEWLRARATQPGLLVVKGPAGVGKTRLVREAAVTLPGSAWFCDLTEAGTAADVCHAIASVLGIDTSGAPGPGLPVEPLRRALGARGRTLLIADNFEQVAAEAAGLLATLVEAATDLTVIVTSRERLGVASEVCFELAPLPPGDAATLFHDRAGRVRTGTASAPAEEQAVRALVQELDGLPLAIELAASRVAILTPAEILARLGQRLDLLRAERRDDPARHHRTLREAIAWSWQLLGPEERATFETCSTFRGGFGLEAAGGGLSGEGLVDRLQALCDRSLLWAEPVPGLPDETRFGMYESLRAFAAERLDDAGRKLEVERRHARVMVELAERAAERTGRAQGAVWRRRLSLEQKNLDAVIDRACATEPTDPEALRLALHAALALEPIVDVTGSWANWVLRLAALEARAATLAAALARPRARARLAHARGLVRLGRVTDGAAFLTSLLADAAGDEEASVRARALLLLACLEAHPDPPRARERFADALATLDGTADAVVEGTIRGRLAAAEHSWGYHEQAVEEATRAIALLEASGELFELGRTLNTLAASQGELGDLDAALACTARSTVIARQIGNPRVECVALQIEAAVAQERRDFAGSRERYERVLAMALEAGDLWLEGIARLYYGRLLHECGAHDDARAEYERALEGLSGRDLRNETIARAALGALLAERGDLNRAVEEIARAESIAGASRPLLQDLVAIWAGHLDLARARAAASDCDGGTAERLRTAVDARVQQAAPRSEDARVALRMLRTAAEAARRERGVLRVRDDGGQAVTPDGVCVVLGRHRALKRLLLALAAREPSASPLGADDLFEAGWPGQRARPASRKNRVYVALSALRALGLRDLIVSRDGGWLIDPSVRVVLARDLTGGAATG